MQKTFVMVLLAICAASFSKMDHIEKSADSAMTWNEDDGLPGASASMAVGQISTFLTFQNNDAEEAMNFYVRLFENSKIIDVQRHGKDGPAKEGTIFVARFELNGSQFACSDSYIKHEWDFTPGVSIWVNCTNNDEIDTLFTKLSEGGKVFMPLDNYGFSQKFSFVEDRFGVSWQLNLN